jgi:hypothetical protein
MIFGIPAEQLVPIANFVGLALLGLLAMFGLRFGRLNPGAGASEVEVAGALVDSTAVKALAAAIEAHTVEAIAQRVDAEKNRQALYRLIEAANRFVDEVSDMRREIGDLAKEIARHK